VIVIVIGLLLRVGRAAVPRDLRVERVEAVGPEAAIARKPFVELGERAGLQKCYVTEKVR
jgi:hypothetical protein